MVERVIRVEGLVKRYGNLTAVDGISFEVLRGEVFALLGPNGAGKTTTIEILQTLRSPTSGRVEVLGWDVTSPSGASEIKRRIGVLPQGFSAPERLSVTEIITLFADMYEESRSPGELMRLLGLTEYARVRFRDLSSGLRQRVGIAAALVNDPDLVFLDEPTTGLDPKARRDVWEVLKGLKAAGKTLFLTTHYMEEAEALADRVAIMNRGRIIALDTPHSLVRRYGGRRTVIIHDASPELAVKLGERYPGARILGPDVSIEVDGISEMGGILETISREGHEGDVTVKSPSMEDVFLRLLGSRLTEEGELA